MRSRRRANPVSLILALALLISGPARGSALERAESDKAVLLGLAVKLVERSPSQARTKLDGLLASFPLLQDYVLYYSAQSLASDDPAAARRKLEELLERFPHSVIAGQAALRLARLLPEAGKLERVLELADRYGGGGGADSAELSLIASRLLLDSDRSRAVEYLEKTRHQDPGGALGEEAYRLEGALRKSHPELFPSGPTALLEEASLAALEGRTDDQIRALDEFLRDYPGDRRYLDATIKRARALANKNGKPAAAWWLQTRADKATSLRMKARLVYESAVYSWNGHDNDRALDRFVSFLELGSGLDEEQKAHYAAGRIHESARRYNQAAAEYRRAEAGPDPELAKQGAWRAGWASYRAGNYSGAAWKFGRLADSVPPPSRAAGRAKSASPSGREEALYWRARSLEKAGGHLDEARAVYATLVEEFPDGFYAYLVEKHRGFLAPAPRPESLKTGAVSLPPDLRRAVHRVQALRLAGLGHYAVAEIGALPYPASKDARLALLPVLLEAGAYNRAMRVALDLYRKGTLGDNHLYAFLYPEAYRGIVQREAAQHGLDPWLIYGLMKQESAFDPNATSPSSAFGLMQLLLPTAKRTAPRAGLATVERSDLFKPEVNIALGTAYLAKLAAEFDANPVLMLAGYNAGENAAARWQNRLIGLEEDEFIERISYRETRNYVKKVLKNARNYRRLYDSTSSQGVDETTREATEGAVGHQDHNVARLHLLEQPGQNLVRPLRLPGRNPG